VIGRDGDAPILIYDAVTPRADHEADAALMPNWAGQGVGLVGRTQPAAEIVGELVAGAEAALQALLRPDG
jgi:hypothetical protein